MDWIYLGILIGTVIIVFCLLKRPMYEAILAGFLLVVVITGNIANIGGYLLRAANSHLLYTIAAFIVFGSVFEKSGIINDMIDIIVALVGRFSGGAGYVSLVASSAMGALSGTGPGNAAAVGPIVIPAMIKTGFSPELAATIEMAVSALGPVIPPSGSIFIMYGILNTVNPGKYTFSSFWLLSWVVAFWFLAQRFITLFVLIKHYKVQPVPEEDRLPLKQALKKGWRSLLLPLVIFVPLFLDAMYSDSFITSRLGSAGASAFSAILLAVVPSTSIIYVLWLRKQKGAALPPGEVIGMVGQSMGSVAPVIIMAFVGFAIGELFEGAGIVAGIAASLEGVHIPLWFIAVVVPLFFTVLGMFLEGTAIIMIFGGIFITVASAAGVHPMLSASMVNAMSYAMGHMTPPFALCFFICMGIAKSDFKKTTQITLVWCLTQYILTILIFFGVLPMFGALV